MMNKCSGCGAILQNEDINALGYTRNISGNLCERCFRIKNYGDYKLVDKDNFDFLNILKDINNTNELVVLVVDMFNLSKDFDIFKKYLNNNILLVLTKRDLLPDFYEQKVLDYVNSFNLNIIDKVMISSKNNYNFDTLYNKLKKYKKAYIIGYTNAGKSTLINKLIYHYGDKESNITTSMLPNTTIDTIEIKLNDLILIDTPGILDNGSIINHIDIKDLKKITPKKTIKPITYQIKSEQTIIIDKFLKLELNNNDITIFMSNELKIDRYYKEVNTPNLVEHEIKINDNSDIVISGLGFIKCKKAGTIKISVIEGTHIYTRKSLI